MLPHSTHDSQPAPSDSPLPGCTPDLKRSDQPERPADPASEHSAFAQNPPDPPQPASPAPATRSTLRSPAAHLRFWTIAIGGLALDLWSKDWAFQTLRQGGRRVLIPRVLEFQTMMNDGALFGLWSGRTTVFLVASALALLLVGWMFAQSGPRQRILHFALGAILAGALGNMYDRIFVQLVELRGPGGVPRYWEASRAPGGVLLREYPPDADSQSRLISPEYAVELPPPVGHVRDFIKIPTRIFGDRELWPWVFNVADALLVCGVIVLALRLWTERDPKRHPAPK